MQIIHIKVIKLSLVNESKPRERNKIVIERWKLLREGFERKKLIISMEFSMGGGGEVPPICENN